MSLNTNCTNNFPSYQAVVVDESFRKCYCGQCVNHEAGDSPASSKTCTCSPDSVNGKKVRRKKRSKSSFKQSCKPDRKVLRNEVDWYRHLAKLERLSKPVEPCCLMCPPNRGAKVPLKKLCPRIKALAQPRNPCKKREYVKDPDEVSLPGAVKDWPNHCRWLERIAQPKMYYDPQCDEVSKDRRSTV